MGTCMPSMTASELLCARPGYQTVSYRIFSLFYLVLELITCHSIDRDHSKDDCPHHYSVTGPFVEKAKLLAIVGENDMKLRHMEQIY